MKTNLKLGIVIHSNESETVWNALRFANFSRQKGDAVKVFLLGRGVEVESVDTDQFRVTTEIKKFAESGVRFLPVELVLKSDSRRKPSYARYPQWPSYMR